MCHRSAYEIVFAGSIRSSRLMSSVLTRLCIGRPKAYESLCNAHFTRLSATNRLIKAVERCELGRLLEQYPSLKPVHTVSISLEEQSSDVYLPPRKSLRCLVRNKPSSRNAEDVIKLFESALLRPICALEPTRRIGLCQPKLTQERKGRS